MTMKRMRIHDCTNLFIYTIYHKNHTVCCRFMMLIDGPNEVYMVDRDNTVFHVPNLQVSSIGLNIFYLYKFNIII